MQNEAFRANWRKPSEELANPLQSLNTIEESYLHRFVGDSNKIGLIPRLSLFGMNIVLMIMVSYFHLNISPMLYNLLVAAVVFYLILGPVVFVAPLLPFRDGMIRTKADLMEEIAVRLRLELDRLRTQLVGGPISKDDEEIIDRLRKLASVIDDLPVWPFDAITLRKFLSAYIIPILSSAGLPAVKTIFDFFKVHLNVSDL